MRPRPILTPAGCLRFLPMSKLKSMIESTRWLAVLVACCLLTNPSALCDENEAENPTSLDQYDALIDQEDRDHWAYQPVRRPPIPNVCNVDWPRNPIDNFVLAKLEARGWQPSPSAPPHALLRRVYFDLIGLPPPIDAQDAFLADPSDRALDEVIESLLASPAYGERWGRHWLDLVRYAETNGYERDATKPHVWRYRDYVIRSFNEDTPYDRFTLEQLAGDELPDADSQTIIATGYYRLGPWDDEPADPKTDRFDQLDDIVSTTSQVFLGMTLGCARCHNHMYEPLTLHDYYRMVAIVDPLKRPQNGRTELDVPAGSQRQLAAIAQRDRLVGELEQRIARVRKDALDQYLLSGKSSLSEAVLMAFQTSPEKRNDAQNQLVSLNQQKYDEAVAAALDDKSQAKIAAAEAEIRRLRAATLDLPRGYFMQENSAPPETHLLLRGKAFAPGPKVEPGFPAVLVSSQPEFLPPSDQTSRRRLTMARWIADANNTLTARVIVNRVWQQHFGEGIVRTPSDFGTMGAAPTHPELLDCLADWFVNEGGWSLKNLHRLMMTTNTYRMSRAWNDRYGEENPENELLWRLPYRRLEVEAIRDSMLAASGRLNREMYGPSMYPHVPAAALEGHSDPDKIWKPLVESDESRRTVYAFIKRSLLVPMLEVLDLCDTTKTTPRRQVTSVAPQALTLLNSDFVQRQSQQFAARLTREAGDDPAQQIAHAYRLALGRRPTDGEVEAMTNFLSAESAKLIEEHADLAPAEAQRRALVQLCRVIFNLNEFVYCD